MTVRVSEPVGAGDLLELRPKDNPDAFLTATVPVDARATLHSTVPPARASSAARPPMTAAPRRSVAR